MKEAINIFLSYSRLDLEGLKELNKHLASLRRTKKIKIWHDRDIEAGSEWESEIQNYLNNADVIILLISANFLNSEYCYSKELTMAIERHDASEAFVIPVILKPCLWNLPDIPFSKLSVLPENALPITKWEDPEEAFMSVALHISNLVEKLKQTQGQEQKQKQKSGSRYAERQKKYPKAQKEAEVAAKQRQVQSLPQQKVEDLKGNYIRLKALLMEGQWREADEETAKQLCEVMGHQKQLWLRIEDIDQFPCADLCLIDRLWVKYSDGKFGFSVQKQIWQQCTSSIENNQQWEKFGEIIGWRSKNGDWFGYEELTFDLTAPKGHLPADYGGRSMAYRIGEFFLLYFTTLISRLVDCCVK